MKLYEFEAKRISYMIDRKERDYKERASKEADRYESIEWDGGLFTGKVHDGLPDGTGKLVKDRDCFEGFFVQGIATGFGRKTLGGQVIRGQWENDHPVGNHTASIKYEDDKGVLCIKEYSEEGEELDILFQWATIG